MVIRRVEGDRGVRRRRVVCGVRVRERRKRVRNVVERDEVVREMMIE